MTMQYDVKALYATSSPTTYSNRTRIKGFVYLGSGTAGSLVYTDVATGAVLYQMAISATDTSTISCIFPGEGILAPTGFVVTFSGLDYVTTIYG
jgi:hypothetical protein